jgi:hypothetical protein
VQSLKGMSRRNGLCVDHCGSLANEAVAEARAGGTVSVAA